MVQLTKDADKVICYIYKDYLQSRKEGNPKNEAIDFEEDYYASHKVLSSWLKSDFDSALLELGRNKLIQIWLGGSFELTDNGIIYMENRFKNGLIEVTDFIAKFIP